MVNNTAMAGAECLKPVAQGLRFVPTSPWAFGLGFWVSPSSERRSPSRKGSILTWNAAFAAASAASWAALGYAAFFSMFLGYFAWNAGLARGGIARVSQVQLLQSFVTIAVAAVLLGKDISPATLAFAAAVAFVVWMGRRAKIA